MKKSTKKILSKVMCAALTLFMLAQVALPVRAAGNVVAKSIKVGDKFVIENCSASSFEFVEGDATVISNCEVEYNHNWGLEITGEKPGKVTFKVEQEIDRDWTWVDYTVTVNPVLPTIELPMDVNTSKLVANVKRITNNSNPAVAQASIKKVKRKTNLKVDALAEGETDIEVVMKNNQKKMIHVVVTDPNAKPVEPEVTPDVPVENKIVKNIKVGESFDMEICSLSGITYVEGDETYVSMEGVEINGEWGLRVTGLKEGKVVYTANREIKGEWTDITYEVTIGAGEVKPDPDVKPNPDEEKPLEPEVTPDVPVENKIVKNIKVGESFDMEICSLSGITYLEGDETYVSMEGVEIKGDWGLRVTGLKEGKVVYTANREIKGEWTDITYEVTIGAGEAKPNPDVPVNPDEEKPVEPSIPTEAVNLNLGEHVKLNGYTDIIGCEPEDVVDARIVTRGFWFYKTIDLEIDALKVGEADVHVIADDGSEKILHVVVTDSSAVKPEDEVTPSPDKTIELKVGQYFNVKDASASSYEVLSGDETVVTTEEVEIDNNWGLKVTAAKAGTVTFKLEQEINRDWTWVTYTVVVK